LGVDINLDAVIIILSKNKGVIIMKVSVKVDVLNSDKSIYTVQLINQGVQVTASSSESKGEAFEKACFLLEKAQ